VDERSVAGARFGRFIANFATELASHIPGDAWKSERVKLLESYGCVTRMHVVSLVAPPLEGEEHTKDIDFSREGIGQRRAASRDGTHRVLESKPWSGDFDPMEGFILHEVDRGVTGEGK
jgi:NTE family protein